MEQHWRRSVSFNQEIQGATFREYIKYPRAKVPVTKVVFTIGNGMEGMTIECFN